MWKSLTVLTSFKYTSVYWPFSENGTWPRFFVTDAWIIQELGVSLGFSSSTVNLIGGVCLRGVDKLVTLPPMELRTLPLAMVEELL